MLYFNPKLKVNNATISVYKQLEIREATNYGFVLGILHF